MAKMAKNFGKLINRSGLPLVTIATLSVGTIYFVINMPNGNTKQSDKNTTLLSDDNTAIKATTNGNHSPVNFHAPNSNITGRDNNSNTNHTNNHVKGTQINTHAYNENCPHANIDRGSNCTNNGSVTNHF